MSEESDWQEIWSEEHQLPYYYNKKTKETVWEDPFGGDDDEEDEDEEPARPMYSLNQDEMTEEEYEEMERQEQKRKEKRAEERQRQQEDQEAAEAAEAEAERKAAEAKAAQEKADADKAVVVTTDDVHKLGAAGAAASGLSQDDLDDLVDDDHPAADPLISEMDENELQRITTLNQKRNAIAHKAAIDDGDFKLVVHLGDMSHAEQAQLRAMSNADIAEKLGVNAGRVVFQEHHEPSPRKAEKKATMAHSVSFPAIVVKKAEVKERLDAVKHEETLATKNAWMKQTIEELQQQVNEYQKSLPQLTTKLNLLQDDLPRKKAEIAKLEKQLEQSRASEEALKAELAKAGTGASAETNSADDGKSAVELQAALEAAEESVKSHSKASKAAKEEAEKLQEKLANSEKEREDLELKLKEVEGKAAAAAAQVSSMRASLKKAKEDKEADSEAASKAAEEIAALKASNEELKKKVNFFQQEQRKRKGVIKKNDMGESMRVFKDMQKEKTALEEELQKTKEELAAAVALSTSTPPGGPSAAATADAEPDQSGATADVDDAKQDADAGDTADATADSADAAEEKERAASAAAAADLERAEELQSLKDAKEESDRELKAVSRQLEAAHENSSSELVRLQEIIDNQKEQIRTLTSQTSFLNGCYAEIEDLNNRLTKSEDARAELKAELEARVFEVTKELKNAEEDASAAKALVKEMDDTVKSKQEGIRKLRDELTDERKRSYDLALRLSGGDSAETSESKSSSSAPQYSLFRGGGELLGLLTSSPTLLLLLLMCLAVAAVAGSVFLPLGGGTKTEL